jgi:formaldehyde-activating enzyme involved in methanogenesis
MDLITADPAPAPAPASSGIPAAASMSPSSAAQPTALGKPAGEKRSKRTSLMQIHSDTVSAAKAALNPVRANIIPQKQKKKVGLVAEKVWESRNVFLVSF